MAKHTVSVVLDSDGMGDSGDAAADEADYDAFCDFVEEHLDERVDFEVDVDRAPFGKPGRAPHGEDEQAVAAVREALQDLWDEWCAGAGSESGKEEHPTATAENPRPTATGVERGVDVDVVVSYRGKEFVGEVTLLPHEDGRPGYGRWGSTDHWVSNGLLADLQGHCDEDELARSLDVIEAAAAEAAKGR